jgi:hypothetical protein
MYADLISTVTVFEDRPYRNIKGVRVTQNLYDDLGDEEEDVLAAVAAETLGKLEPREPFIRRPFEYDVIAYPFVHENWQQTRFSDGSRYGVWYGSLEIETTLFETAYHWRRFLLETYPDEDRDIVSDRRVIRVFCQGVLVDLRGKEKTWPALIADGHEFTQQLGAYLRNQNLNGLLGRSARCEGTNLASFTPDILSNPEDVCYLTYRFNPKRRGYILIERSAGVTWMEI